MQPDDATDDREEEEQEHPGGGRFNRLLGVAFVAIAMLGGVLLALGVQSSGTRGSSSYQKPEDDLNSAARDRSEVEDLAAHGAVPHASATVMPAGPVIPLSPQVSLSTPPKPPSRYTQWAEDKYMKALESPEMVQAFHNGSALEVANLKPGEASSLGQNDPAVNVHPAASPYTVMAGSILPAVLISGINSDLPGPVLAQVSENVFDSATGRHLLVPQGSRLIGAYQSASTYAQRRIQIVWQRLIFPNAASMNLPQMPGADRSGYAGFSDQIDNHYLATFGTAALMSLISAGQAVGQMAAFGGGGSYGPYGYYQPNQWEMASQAAGSAASGQLGQLGQQLITRGLNRPPTLEIRPGYQFDLLVTQDLVFPGPYAN